MALWGIESNFGTKLGTFQVVPNAGGAVGPVGIAAASGAGTADSVVSADYNLDGFLDLFVTNGFNLRPLGFGGPNKLFRNQGNGNRWVQVDLVGRQSDRGAVGARVYAMTPGLTQMRVQDGSYHRWSQDMPRAHFGLAARILRRAAAQGPVHALGDVADGERAHGESLGLQAMLSMTAQPSASASLEGPGLS